MKKRIITLAVIMLISGSISAHAESPSNLYPETGIITTIKYPEESDYGCLITVTVANGNRFQYYSEDGDWFVNDIVSMEMDTMGSEYVRDHEIIKVKYAGTLEQLAQWVVEE